MVYIAVYLAGCLGCAVLVALFAIGGRNAGSQQQEMAVLKQIEASDERLVSRSVVKTKRKKSPTENISA
ncbi:MAG: hypothetical protein AAGF28_09180 [Pseudomonadota bacterium]